MNIEIKNLLNILPIKEEIYLLNIYLFGSRVYQTFNHSSDYDFLIVIPNHLENYNNSEYKNGLYNIHLITEDNFRTNLINHKIKEMECYFSPEFAKIKETITPIKFQLNLNILREEISSKSNNSWVKAKKKMELMDEDTYIGVKSLFHSLRILKFGIQIATHGKIIDFNENALWVEIESEYHCGWTWSDFKLKYQPIINQLSSEFKKVAPKDNKK